MRAVVVVVAVFVGAIGLARLGESSETSPSVVAPTSVARASAVAVPAPTAAIHPSTASLEPLASPSVKVAADAFVEPLLGFRVAAADAPGEVVTISADSRLVMFTHSRTSLASPGYGTIVVAVGTPAQGAAIGIGYGPPRVFADSVDALYAAFLALPGVHAMGAHPTTLDHRFAWLVEATLDPDPESLSIALAANAGRTFVIAAIGFDAGSHTASAAARKAELDAFLKRFAWDGQPLFASAALGFEAPALTAPAMVKLDAADPAAGSAAFRDLRSDPAIRVDVGTQMAPAWPPVDGSHAGIWSDTLDGLLAGFVSAWGSGTSMTRVAVDGEPAMRIEHPGTSPRRSSLSTTAAYVITTYGDSVESPAPEFDEFLRQFRFLPATARSSAPDRKEPIVADDAPRVGITSITSYLIVRNAAEAIEFYRRAFDAVETARFDGADGRVSHAELGIGDGRIYLADEFPEQGILAPRPGVDPPVILDIDVNDDRSTSRRSGSRPERSAIRSAHLASDSGRGSDGRAIDCRADAAIRRASGSGPSPSGSRSSGSGPTPSA